MSAVVLTWNNKDLSDLKIVARSDGGAMIFGDSFEANDYGKKNFVNFETVTITEKEEE